MKSGKAIAQLTTKRRGRKRRCKNMMMKSVAHMIYAGPFCHWCSYIRVLISNVPQTHSFILVLKMLL